MSNTVTMLLPSSGTVLWYWDWHWYWNNRCMSPLDYSVHTCHIVSYMLGQLTGTRSPRVK